MHAAQNSSPGARRIAAVWLLGAMALTIGCASARSKAITQVTELNRTAIAELKKGRAKAAQQQLLEALRVAEEAELGQDPLLARTHLALGAVYAGPLKDRAKASTHMRKALDINPKSRLTTSLASPAARQALAAARVERRGAARKRAAGATARAPVDVEAPAAAPAAAAAEGRAVAPAVRKESPEPAEEAAPPPKKVASKVATKSGEPDLPAEFPTPLFCPSPPDSPPEEEVVLRCAVAPTTRPGKLSLYYRTAGTETFTEVPMSRTRKGWYTGVVPASATSAKSLQYYVEGKGTPRLASGQPDSPNLILLREGDDDADGGGDDEPPLDENPLADVEADRAREHLHLRPPGKVWLGLGTGYAYGWQPGGELEFRKDQKVAAGMLGGGLLLMPEVGYQWTERLSFSAQLRFQHVPTEGSGDATAGNPATRAIAILVRGTYTVGDDNLRPFVSVVAGGGDGFRLKVPPSREASLVRSDTVKGGPLVGGAGVGLIYHFNPHVAWPTELRGLVGAPSLAAVAELTTAIEVAF
jgi:hypothetical protein